MKVEAKIDAPYIESVLERYGFEKIRKTKNGYLCMCKFHDNNKTPAFSISNSGLWMCWSCGVKGNIKQLHERLGGEMGWQEEVKMIGAQLNIARFSSNSSNRKPLVLPRDFKKYGNGNRCPDYILKRLQAETIIHFALGSSEEGKNAGRCIVPIYYKGKAVGFHGRALTNDTELKYYNSPGFEIKEFLFNYDGCERGKDIIVVEGAFNAMSMWEKGFPNTVATFGTKFTPKQVQLIFSLSPENIIICFDRDRKTLAGQKASKALADLTYQLIPTYIMPLPFDKDPNDLSAEVLMLCHQKRVAYDKIRG